MSVVKVMWNFLLTQFLTNRGNFRSYLHKINKTPSPNCNFPKKAIQTARHLMTECSSFSNDRPAVLKSLPPILVLKYHINTVSITIFLISDFRRDLNIVYFLLGISPASNCSWPTFRKSVSVPSSKAGCTVCTHCTPSLWRWDWHRVPKRRPTTI